MSILLNELSIIQICFLKYLHIHIFHNALSNNLIKIIWIIAQTSLCYSFIEISLFRIFVQIMHKNPNNKSKVTKYQI